MKKIMTGLLASLFLLTGCGSKEEKTVICNLEENGIKIELTLIGEGDNLVEQKQQTTLNAVDVFGSVEEAERIIEDFKSQYSIKGLTYEAEVTDGLVRETIHTDYKQADTLELYQAGLTTAPAEDATLLLDSTIEHFKQQGYTCE